jgi:hypothetical protein
MNTAFLVEYHDLHSHASDNVCWLCTVVLLWENLRKLLDFHTSVSFWSRNFFKFFDLFSHVGRILCFSGLFAALLFERLNCYKVLNDLSYLRNHRKWYLPFDYAPLKACAVKIGYQDIAIHF